MRFRAKTRPTAPVLDAVTYSESVGQASLPRIRNVVHNGWTSFGTSLGLITTNKLAFRATVEKAAEVEALSGVVEVQRASVGEDVWLASTVDSRLSSLMVAQEISGWKGVVSAFPVLASRNHLEHVPNDPLYAGQWQLQLGDGGVNVEGAWDENVRGNGVRVAVMDSGAELDHEDLVGRFNTAIDYDYFADDFDPYPEPTGNEDFDEFHGTAVDYRGVR